MGEKCDDCKYRMTVHAVLLGLVLIVAALLAYSKVIDATLLALVVGGILTFAGVGGVAAARSMGAKK